MRTRRAKYLDVDAGYAKAVSGGSNEYGAAARGAGYDNAATGNRGGAVKTQNGDVYAGRDGNVYQHSSSGWSKWQDGGWQTVTPPTPPNGQKRQQSGSGGNAQSNQLGANQQRSGATRGMDSSSFQQLEQDRQARFAGSRQRGADGLRNGFGDGGFGRGRRR